ncbi:MAG TPA: glycosyltransferase family 2 protein [Methanocella sp.]|jgi:glycosyltransferase involved in cell wall biosynthesis
MMDKQLTRTRIGVCIPVYNRADLVADCIRSVTAQTHEDVAIYVQDNGSTDGAWEAILDAAAKDTRIKPARNDTNVGMVGNFNRVARRAVEDNCDYIAFMGIDDRLHPRFLECCLRAYEEHPEVGAVACHYVYCDVATGVKLKRRVRSRPGVYDDYRRELLLRAPASINAMLMRRETITSLALPGGDLFPAGVPGETNQSGAFLSFDYDLWLRMGGAGIKLCYLDETLAFIGLGGESKNMARIERQEAQLISRYSGDLRTSTGAVYPFTLLRRMYVSVKHRDRVTFDILVGLLSRYIKDFF